MYPLIKILDYYWSYITLLVLIFAFLMLLLVKLKAKILS